MRQINMTHHSNVILVLIIIVLAPMAVAEVLYIDSKRGDDNDPGTKERPLSTLSKAAMLVNDNSSSGPTIIKMLPGIYNL